MKPGRLVRSLVVASTLAGCSAEAVFDGADEKSSTTSALASTTSPGASGVGGSSPATSGSGDGGHGAGGGGHGGGGGDGGDESSGGGGGRGPGCEAVHVSPRGQDSASGCADDPVRTISAGLERAQEYVLAEVRVCEGAFAEDVVIQQEIELRGGFDCMTWATRSGLVTEIRGAGVQPAAVVLRAEGEVVLEALAVSGAARDDGATSVAILVEEGAPRVSSVVARGGTSVVAAGIGSIGIQVTGGSPELEFVDVHGGEGTAATEFGSVGVQIEGGQPTLRDSTIAGGSGTGASGSAALRVVSVPLAADALERLVLDGGDGHSYGEDGGVLSVGMQVALGASAALVDSDVDAGRGTVDPAEVQDCVGVTYVVGVLGDSSSVALRGDRIWGGTVTLSSPRVFVNVGVLVRTSELEIDDSAIVAGGATVPDGCYTSGRGVWLGGGTARVRSSTIVGTGRNVGAVWIDAGTDVSVEDNLLLAIPSSGNGFGLAWTPACDQDSSIDLASLRRNAFGGTADVAYFGCAAPHLHGDLPSLFADVACDAPTAVVDGNVDLGAECDAGSTACAPIAACADGIDACAGAIVRDWSPQDGGKGALFASSLELTVDVPCAVTRGRGICSGVDAEGLPRTSPCSIGAREADRACGGGDGPGEDSQIGACASGG